MALSKIGSAGLASGAVEAVDLANPNVFMGRNRIINGAMMVSQRNGTSSVTPADGAYTLDRWNYNATQASKMSVQQSTTAPTGFSNSLLITTTTAVSVGAGDTFSTIQAIEGFNFADCAWGTANAKTVTLSFWVRSSLTGTFGGSLLNSAQNRSYPFTYTISSANTFEYKTVTIAGDTTGTWIGATNGVGVRVCFDLGAGSTYSGTAGAWTGSAKYAATGSVSVVGTLNATWYITGVQLEVGSTATDFERRQYGQELMLCQRYFEKKSYSNVAFEPVCNATVIDTSSSTSILGVFQYQIEKRATPTVSFSAGNTFRQNGGGVNDNTASSVSAAQIGRYSFNMIVGSATSRTSGYSTWISRESTTTCYVEVSSEL